MEDVFEPQQFQFLLSLPLFSDSGHVPRRLWTQTLIRSSQLNFKLDEIGHRSADHHQFNIGRKICNLGRGRSWISDLMNGCHEGNGRSAPEVLFPFLATKVSAEMLRSCPPPCWAPPSSLTTPLWKILPGLAACWLTRTFFGVIVFFYTESRFIFGNCTTQLWSLSKRIGLPESAPSWPFSAEGRRVDCSHIRLLKATVFHQPPAECFQSSVHFWTILLLPAGKIRDIRN